MIAADEILTNTFFAFFYCLGNAVDYIWAGAFAGAIVLTLTRLLAKKD
jgi:multisubunit Na+/H+ antiporter MnhE subunit